MSCVTRRGVANVSRSLPLPPRIVRSVNLPPSNEARLSSVVRTMAGFATFRWKKRRNERVLLLQHADNKSST